jgi:hypothetical protein
MEMGLDYLESNKSSIAVPMGDLNDESETTAWSLRMESITKDEIDEINLLTIAIYNSVCATLFQPTTPTVRLLYLRPIMERGTDGTPLSLVEPPCVKIAFTLIKIPEDAVHMAYNSGYDINKISKVPGA